MGDQQEFIVDDTDADVRAAMAEVSGAQQETPAPSGDQPQPREDGRDERGRFVSREMPRDDTQTPLSVTDETQTAKSTTAEEKPAASAEPQQQTASDTPPPSWSVAAKAAWEKLPAEVRADIVKREGEVQQGLAGLRDYKDLKPYAELASQAGTTIKGALDHYLGVDRLLQRDLAGGLAQVAESYGATPQQIGQIFSQLAAKYGASQQSEADPLADILNPLLTPITQQINDLRQQVSQRTVADRNASQAALADAIAQFAADPKNTFFSNVESDMARLFDTGMVQRSGNHAADLRTAYDMAVRLNPETSKALIERQLAEQAQAQRQREQAAAAKARDASRSLGGSRIPGTVVNAVQNGDASKDDIWADVTQAMRAHSQA